MVKVKALVDCVGIGYDMKVDETAEVHEKTAKILVDFGYVEAVAEEKVEEAAPVELTEEEKPVEVTQEVKPEKLKGKNKEKRDK